MLVQPLFHSSGLTAKAWKIALDKCLLALVVACLVVASPLAFAQANDWPAIEAAVAEACAPHGSALLALLQALEEALDAQDLLARVDRHQRTAGDPHAPA